MQEMGDSPFDGERPVGRTGEPLPAAAAYRVVEEVVAFFREPADAFIRRRHRELKSAGLTNEEIFPLVAHELEARPVLAPQLTERQIRRVIYG